MVKFIILIYGIVSFNVVAEQQVLADPTQPLNYKVSATHKAKRPALPKLNSILIADKKHTVILNERLYHVGNWVNGYQIKKIEQDGIILRYKEKLYRLNLYNKNERFIK